MTNKQSDTDKPKQTITFTKKKAGPPLGFRTSDFFKGSKFSGGGKPLNLGKNPSTSFHTQHRGGS